MMWEVWYNFWRRLGLLDVERQELDPREHFGAKHGHDEPGVLPSEKQWRWQQWWQWYQAAAAAVARVTVDRGARSEEVRQT